MHQSDLDEFKIEKIILETMEKNGILTPAEDVENALAKAGYRFTFVEVYKRMISLMQRNKVKGS
uniref:Uncharacterized protein n=1 Tax=Burkholderia phage vB_BgluM-SURPRISE13 TaxID=3159457 RepID=A0AAU7PH04_9VIRU